MPDSRAPTRNPWAWIPTLYLAEGLPYVIVMTVAVVMYKGLGISNTDIALYTSWLYLPWVIKPFWSPVVDMLKTRRLWIWTMQLVIGAGFAGVALTVPTSHFFQYTLAFFWLLAFSSATHDIAADGFYMLATTEYEQAFFVGIRSTFYRVATIFGQGVLVILAGTIQSHTGLPCPPLQVQAQNGAALVETIPPVVLANTQTNAGELRIIAEPASIQINPQPRSSADVKSVIERARIWNTDNGFHTAERTESGAKSASWWTKRVSQPMGGFLQRVFKPTDKAKSSELTGNVGRSSLSLSRPPGRTIAVAVALKSGDKSVTLAEGARLTFNDTNWNKPAIVVFQLDPKLKSGVSAVFALRSGNAPLSWMITFVVLIALFLFFGIYHLFVLPQPDGDKPGSFHTAAHFIREFFSTFGSFFARPKILFLLSFLLIYRFGEAQLVKMVVPFLLDPREAGGLGLTTSQIGFVYGTVGIVALTIGGLLGGIVASRQGLKFWLWPMVLAIHLPDAMFIYLASAQPESIVTISACVAVEQFGYGFGFTAYMLYMIYIARGEHQTAHYAICTGFMALGMMIPGMWSGWLQESIGYQHFFVWVILATIPSFVVVTLIPLDKEFGKKTE
jgi:MFS transporter, PAT family, beta-lactamase induction signal transducer AmpG